MNRIYFKSEIISPKIFKKAAKNCNPRVGKKGEMNTCLGLGRLRI